jgi:ATPase family associated with various cellular activities (AAA)
MEVDEASAAPPAASSSAASSGKRDLTANLPWVEKYRPDSLTDLVSQGDIVSTLERLIGANRLPHLLFYGPPGTGKTSTVLALAKQLYGPKWRSMTLELNASDDRGIDVVREQIKSFAGTRKLFSTGVKLIILDEADAMTNDAQFALRRGEYLHSCCNRVHSLTACFSNSLSPYTPRCTCSHRKVHTHHPFLPSLQLCQQDHSGFAVTLHPFSLRPASKRADQGPPSVCGGKGGSYHPVAVLRRDSHPETGQRRHA